MLSLASCPGRYYIAWTPVVSISSYGTCLCSSTLEACCKQKVGLENQRNDAAVEKHFQGWFIQLSVTQGFFSQLLKELYKCTFTCQQERCSIGLELIRSLCTQARCTLRFRSFAAFLGSTVLSLGLSAIGPTTLQTSDLSTPFEKNLHLGVVLVSNLSRLSYI